MDYLRDGPKAVMPDDETQLKRIRNEAHVGMIETFLLFTHTKLRLSFNTAPGCFIQPVNV